MDILVIIVVIVSVFLALVLVRIWRWFRWWVWVPKEKRPQLDKIPEKKTQILLTEGEIPSDRGRSAVSPPLSSDRLKAFKVTMSDKTEFVVTARSAQEAVAATNERLSGRSPAPQVVSLEYVADCFPE